MGPLMITVIGPVALPPAAWDSREIDGLSGKPGPRQPGAIALIRLIKIQGLARALHLDPRRGSGTRLHRRHPGGIGARWRALCTRDLADDRYRDGGWVRRPPLCRCGLRRGLAVYGRRNRRTGPHDPRSL